MESTYNTTNNSCNQEPLTLDKLKDAMKILDALPPAPFFIYSWFVPYDQIYHGEWIDQMARQMFPGFDCGKRKAYLVSKKWEKEISERITKRFA